MVGKLFLALAILMAATGCFGQPSGSLSPDYKGHNNIRRGNIAEVGSQTQSDVNANPLNTDSNRLDTNAQKSFDKLNGVPIESNGDSLDWNNVRGRHRRAIDNGRLNLWQNKQHSIYAYGLGGPNRGGRPNYGASIGYSYRF
ncbi:uncharacterized protein LOC131684720 [Topomyia yanbarensis]|uniref:uncharacterized protein LOC131684720 n=1 Tax=Topomyia yanbarensis TaxID=2498891 RepID=UPI00273CD421|nr:uncharacterized protein LOC131684720 [Topomyia yanbarensis]